MTDELIHDKVSESIIGAAMAVLNALKPGLDEKLYERALAMNCGSEDIRRTAEGVSGVLRWPARRYAGSRFDRG